MEKDATNKRKELILQLFSDPIYKPMRIKELCMFLDVPKERRQELKEVLDELLEEGNLTVSEVAAKVGFAYASYFSKCFKDAFGVPPTDLTRNFK